MLIIPLSIEERCKLGGRSHMAVVDFTDLNDTAGTAKTLTFGTYAARDIIGRLMFDLVTPAVGASITNLVCKVGYDGAAVDDDDAFLPSTELCAAGTEILAGMGVPSVVATDTVDGTYGTEESTVIGSLRTKLNALLALQGLAAVEAGTIEAVFTSTGANLTALTAFKIRFFFDWITLPEMRGINGT